mgnify:FL=1
MLVQLDRVYRDRKMSFYLQLPSNVPHDVGSTENTPSQYTTRLPTEIVLEPGDWEVALDEISIPLNRDNLTSSITDSSDLRLMMHVWVLANVWPDKATQAKIIGHHSLYWCFALPTDEPIIHPKDAMIALAKIKFNNIPIITFDAATNRLMSMNTDTTNSLFRVFIHKTLAADMGFTINADSLSSLWHQGLSSQAAIWYNFATANYYPRVPRAQVTSIPKTPFETKVINLNKHNHHVDGTISKIVLAYQKALSQDKFGFLPTVTRDSDYPFDIYQQLIKIRSKGDYSSDEILTAIQKAQENSKFKDKTNYGYVKKTGSRSFEMMNVKNIIFTLMMHKSLATALGLALNTDYVHYDQSKIENGVWLQWICQQSITLF